MTDQTIVAYHQGIAVMVVPKNCFINKNGTLIAAIEKTDDRVPDGIPVPKHVPFDNLSFENGQKCQATKFVKKLVMRQKKEKNKKNKTIKMPVRAY